MIVNIFNQQDKLAIDIKKVEEIVKHVLQWEGHCAQEVSISFIGKQEIAQLHLEYFDDPSPTDCISFPMDDETETTYRLLGDVFVCPEVAVEYAKSINGDPNAEVTLYIVHGLLHLIGYDDIEETDRALMREAEAKNIRQLEKCSLILS